MARGVVRTWIRDKGTGITMSSSPLYLLRWPRRAFCNRTAALDHGLAQRVWGKAVTASQADVLEKQRSGDAQGQGTGHTVGPRSLGWPKVWL